MDAFTLKKVEFDAVRGILSGFCSCSLGKSLAAKIGPSRRPEVVRRWLEQVSQMAAAVCGAGPPPFGGVTDIHGQLTRATPGGGASGEDFAAIASCLDGAANVKSHLESLPAELAELKELAGRIGSFEAEIRAIGALVGPDGIIGDDASPRLAELRREIAATGRQIHDVIYGYLRQGEVARLLQNPKVTLHGDRYVLPVKAANRGRLPGVVHRTSSSGATVFVEPNASVELNNRLADLRDDERREIQRLLNELAVWIGPRIGEIAASLRTLAQIDLLSAKARYAIAHDMTCPEVTELGPLELWQARHPLLADAPSATHPVVPIDVRLGADFDLLVITGSNTGGKTVAMKTVALLALMVQSGMHIPVRRGSRMPVFGDVFIDVGDEQSLQQSLSTFGAHVKRLRYILRHAGRSSLVLLDELGAGTDPEEGGAIGQAMLDELRRIGCLGMVTTHLTVLKAYAYNQERVDNASVEFDTATLSPTYHLRIGTPGQSHAITVAGRLGLPKHVVASARQYLSRQGKEFRRAIQATNLVRQAAEAARGHAQAAQLSAETQQQMYQAKLADLHRLQGEFETWLATLCNLTAGDEIFVPQLGKTARLVRLELHRQIALVDSGSVQIEIPLRELMPDLGQSAVREQIGQVRDRILAEAQATEQARSEAERVRREYHKSMELQRTRARQFDTWLGAIGRLKVGDEAPIARQPGKARVLSVDLPGLRATVRTNDGELTLPIQELFPQTGPFAPRPPRRPAPSRDKKQKRHHPSAADDKRKTQPIRRRDPNSKSARGNLETLLATSPGEPVFVVPFNKRATLIRINAAKGQAVVQSGIFEMELPLSDLEPIRDSSSPKARKNRAGEQQDG